MGETSSRLFIHRNTLNYRLRKIELATGCNPKRFDDLFKLYTAITLFSPFCANEQFKYRIKGRNPYT
ncbi:helix-turn-helix domain-containing protein [Bacillus licheniformis]|uniref:helix-turn-helix domain-containing protein n=1 Tax=Bacillus licheniformis TaxID=1402 RepID=UPI0021BD334D|nr:helix-turn-helix domain-containing protein [Bacillus licheniformis]